MKNFLLVIFIVFFSENVWSQIYNSQMSIPTPLTQPETNLNVAEPNQVLVVFKRGDQVSRQIKEHYVQVRTIPSLNIVREGINNLEGLDFNIPAGITLAQNGEVIKRALPCSDYNSNGYCDYAAWQFYIDEIATPIANYLNNTYDPSTGQYLKNQIRYIVLCKGIPLKIMSGDPYWYWPSINVSVDGLLCLLNNNNSNPSVLTLYPPTTPPGIYQSYSSKVPNPYFGVDQSYTMNYRFKSNFFQLTHYNNGQNTNWKIAYLVSRLDGRNLNEVIQLIDNSVAADHSGEGQWIIDTHTYRDSDWTPPNPYYASTYNTYNNWSLAGTVNKLNNNGFNVISDNNSRNYITSTSGSVNGYLSWGQHAGMQATYLTNLLNFTYAPGAVFNSIESFNAYSMDPQFRWDNQGMITEFVQTEGTDGAGHTWEPFLYQNNESYYSFPAYAMGYGLVDAMYQGIPKLGWQNIVIGDPLTTIAWGKQTLTQNLTWSGTNLVTGKITVPSGKTLTIASNAVINFKHQGALDIQTGGSLVIQSGAVLNINGGNTFEFTNSVTVPTGATLNINSGATIKFSAGKSLIVNGTLYAVGIPSNRITFDRIGTTGTWGGLVFNNSFMNVNNCNIYHATYGVKCDNPCNGPNIQNCTISSCGTGIYATNYYGGTITNNSITGCMTGIYLYNIPPVISGNSITGNAYYGISCNYYSSPYIYENSIQSVQTAISCNTYSNIHLTTQSNGPGFNEIISNSKGVYSNYSTPFLGSSSVHGNNYFENSTKYIEAYNSGVIWAQYNCWSPYDVNNFYAGSGTTIYHSPYDCSFLNKSASISDNEDISTGLEEALNLELTGNFEQALGLYKKIFELKRDTEIGRYCFVKISDCYSALNKSGLNEYLTNILTEKNANTELDAVRIELINRDLMKDRKFDEVLVNLNKISSNNSYSTEIRKNNLFNTALLYLNCYNNYSKAKEIFNEFSKQYPDDKLNLDAELLMITAVSEEHQNSLAKETKTENQTIDNDNNVQYSLSDCYPNPFNPSTVINYSVKDVGLVKVKIYDILGSEIAELVHEIQEPGNHSVEFNASNFPSGVYIYTLQVNGFSASRKMLLLK